MISHRKGTFWSFRFVSFIGFSFLVAFFLFWDFKSNSVPVSSLLGTNCSLSLMESSDFFCESSQRWILRKQIFRHQETLQISEKSDLYFKRDIARWWMSNYEPNFSCEFEKRIGRQGDGGKWVCNPNRVVELSRHRDCVIFSFGSNNDFSFEVSLHQELPECSIHTFDHTIVPHDVPHFVTFHSIGLGSEDASKMRKLSTIMDSLKIDRVEILKIDIEKGEWDTLIGTANHSRSGILESDSFPFARQVLIELHPVDIDRTRRFFELMSKRGYVISHKEPNLIQKGKLVEYTFFKAFISNL